MAIVALGSLTNSMANWGSLAALSNNSACKFSVSKVVIVVTPSYLIEGIYVC
jgi:hypothetical protein